MNSEEPSGGSSSKGQENGDGFNGSERPLKKARFAWQVKGKYHLKNENNDPAKISTTESTAPEMAGPSGSGSNSSNSNNIGTEQDKTRQDIKTIGGYILNRDFNTLDSVDDELDKSVLKPSKRNLSTENNPVRNIFTPRATVAEEIINHTRDFSSQEDIESSDPLDAHLATSQYILSKYLLANSDTSHSDEFVPISLVELENYTEDECIARWQARQIAKGPLDNTINRVLDYIKQNPVGEENPTLEAFDVANFINNLPGVNSVENEGILMAISAHGLQNTSNSSSSFNSFSSSSMSLDFEEICLPNNRSPTLRISFSPIHSDDESHEQGQQEFEYALDNAHWSYSDELKNEDDETIPSPTFHGTSSLTFQNLYENLHNTDAATNDVAIENDNHRDFLDAAVLFAIQSRGLTTFGTDYG